MSLAEARRALGGPEDTLEVTALANGFETVAAFRRSSKTVAAVFPGRITQRSRAGLVGVRTCVSTRGREAEAFAARLKSELGEPSDGGALLDAGLREGGARWESPSCPVEVRAFRSSQWWDPSADELCVEFRAVRPPAEAPVIRRDVAVKRPEPPPAPEPAPAERATPSTVALVEPPPVQVPAPVPVQVPLQASESGSDGYVRATATAPRLVSSSPPQYPPLLRQRRIRARVVVRATILTDGTVGEVVVAENDHPGLGLEDRVVAAVRKWRYKPATQSGTPVTAEIFIPFEFQ